MSEVVTFFATGQASEGSRCRILKPNGGCFLIHAYERLLGKDIREARKKPDRDAARLLLHATGGLLVEESPGKEQTTTSVLIRSVPGAAAGTFPLPSRAYLLDGSPEPKPREMGNPIDVDLGDHLVVPVDKASERALDALLDLLRGLPGDTMAVMLGSLRHPGLEADVDRLERDVAALGTRGQGLQWASVGVSAAALAGVVVFGVLGLVLRPNPAPLAVASATSTGTASAAPPIAPTTSATVKEERKHPFDDALERLTKALEERAAHEPRVRQIFYGHFPMYSVPLTRSASSEQAAWGLVKLSLLRVSPLTVTQYLGSEQRSGARRNLSKIEEHEAKHMLAFACCRVWNDPALRAYKEDSAPRSAPFAESTCADVLRDEDTAVRAVTALTGFVKDLKPPSQGGAQ